MLEWLAAAAEWLGAADRALLWAAAGFALLILIVLDMSAGALLAALDSRALLAALRDSTRSVLELERGPGPNGFTARFVGGPEPFTHLAAVHRPESGLAAALLVRPWGKRAMRLALYGRLAQQPTAELDWQRGRPPGHALGRADHTTLWANRRLHLTRSEYLVRGSNTSGVEHTLMELHTRFGPLLDRVRVEARDGPQVEVALRLHALNEQEAPALVNAVRSLGRAALL